MKIILLLFLLFGNSPTRPPLDPECIGDYSLLWEIRECKICDNEESYGDYYLYICEIEKYSPTFGTYKSSKFVSQCIYDSGLNVPQTKVFIAMLPIVTNWNTVIGEPIFKP